MASRQDYLKFIIKQIETTPYIANSFLNNQYDEFKVMHFLI